MWVLFINWLAIIWNRRRFNNFATMVHDRQTHVGCAAVKYRKGKYYNFYLVCNYAVSARKGGKVYKAGIPYTGCTAGRSQVYPGLCAINEPIKAVAYGIASSEVNSLRKKPKKSARGRQTRGKRRQQRRARRPRTRTRARGRVASRLQQRRAQRRSNRIQMANQSQANPFGNIMSFFGG